MKEKETVVNQNWKRLSAGKWSLVLTILLLLTVSICNACYEEDMTVSVDDSTPPTFRLSGSGNLVFFGIWEVAPENQKRIPSERDGDKDTIVWQILPNRLSPAEKVIRRLPPITYGSVPTGFEQKIPQDGVPANLVEGKIYEAGGPASNANGGFVWFTIEGNKVRKVDAPGGN